jgi:hypothetical protein
VRSPIALSRCLALLAAPLLACAPEPVAPLDPTWADAEPILRGQCNHCHGGSAATTGALGAAVYRFDFYDMNAEICGEAAGAMNVPALAYLSAKRIKDDITVPPGVVRARMPPAPAEPLADWERETLIRWADRGAVKGPMPTGNRLPRLEVSRFPATADRQLDFVAVLSDPDGESALGVLKLRDVVYRMDRPGSFAVTLDTASWEPGTFKVTAIVCDGWQNTSYEVGQINIRH